LKNSSVKTKIDSFWTW